MSRNVSGQAYALTVLTPIKDGHQQPLIDCGRTSTLLDVIRGW